jgi:hypothetical protein
MVFAWAIIYPDFCGSAERRHNDVQLPIVIKVAERRAAVAPRGLGSESRLLRQRRPSASGAVSEHGVGLVNLHARGHSQSGGSNPARGRNERSGSPSKTS